jgi:predicted NUDIX family NTP pyrophosphohydrolase
MVGHVARMGNEYKVSVGEPEGRDYSEELGIDGKIILEGMLKKQGGKVWTVFIWLKIRTNGGLL